MEWRLLVPVKPLALAKSRLDLPAAQRQALALAMAADVLAVARTMPGCQVAVIGDDPSLRSLDAPLLPGVAGGLSAAVASAAAAFDGPLAVLAGDLPSLRTTELAAALAAAAVVPAGMVSDTQGSGTTLLTARSRQLLQPAYGEGSRARHLASGSVDIGAALSLPGLRRDVDTLADLGDALALGVGAFTRRVIDSVGIDVVHLSPA